MCGCLGVLMRLLLYCYLSVGGVERHGPCFLIGERRHCFQFHPQRLSPINRNEDEKKCASRGKLDEIGLDLLCGGERKGGRVVTNGKGERCVLLLLEGGLTKVG